MECATCLLMGMCLLCGPQYGAREAGRPLTKAEMTTALKDVIRKIHRSDVGSRTDPVIPVIKSDAISYERRKSFFPDIRFSSSSLGKRAHQVKEPQPPLELKGLQFFLTSLPKASLDAQISDNSLQQNLDDQGLDISRVIDADSFQGAEVPSLGNPSLNWQLQKDNSKPLSVSSFPYTSLEIPETKNSFDNLFADHDSRRQRLSQRHKSLRQLRSNFEMNKRR